MHCAFKAIQSNDAMCIQSSIPDTCRCEVFRTYFDILAIDITKALTYQRANLRLPY